MYALPLGENPSSEGSGGKLRLLNLLGWRMAKLQFKIAPGNDAVVGADGKTLVIGPSGTFGGWCSCGYKTTGWPSEDVAAQRLAQHVNEHDAGEPMEPLEDFRDRLGLVPDGRAKAVFPEGARDLVEVSASPASEVAVVSDGASVVLTEEDEVDRVFVEEMGSGS